jgi:hypothetical protein
MEGQSKITVDWNAIRQVPPGKEGTVRAHCETCDFPIYSEGGLKIPSLKGYYCRAICIEQALCGIKKSDVPLGQRLLNHIRMRHPELYRALIGSEYGKQEKMAFSESLVTVQKD